SLLRGRRGLGVVDAGKGLGPRVDAYALAVDLDVGDARSVRIKADADVIGLRLRGGDDQFAGHLLVAVAAEDRAGERESALAVGRELDDFGLPGLDRFINAEFFQREAMVDVFGSDDEPAGLAFVDGDRLRLELDPTFR